MSKQTSIEWLEMELKKLPSIDVLKTFEKSKQMHKEEIVEAFEKGYDDYEVLKYDDFEEYYNETYGSNHIVDTNEMIDHIGDANKMVEISDDQAIEIVKDMNKQLMRYHCVPKEISDDDIFKQSIKAMEEMYGSGSLTEIDAYFRGAKWMQKQLKGGKDES